MRTALRSILLPALLAVLGALPLPTQAQVDRTKEVLLVLEPVTNRLRVLDPRAPTPALLQTLTIEGASEGAVFANGRLFWVKDRTTVVEFELGSGNQSTVASTAEVLSLQGAWPAPLGVAPDASRLLIAHYRATGPGLAHEVSTFWLSAVDTRTGAAVKIPAEPEAVRTSPAAACLVPQLLLAPDQPRAYELCIWNGSGPLSPTRILRTIDLAGGIIGQVDLPGALAAGLSTDGKALYAVTSTGTLYIVDPAKPALVEKHVLSNGISLDFAERASRVVVSPDGKRLYLSTGRPADSPDKANVFAVETGTWKTVAHGALREAAEDLAASPDGQLLYALTPTRLAVLKAADLKEQSAFELGRAALGSNRALFVVPAAAAPTKPPTVGGVVPDWIRPLIAGGLILLAGAILLARTR